jgi:hypothetical protein
MQSSRATAADKPEDVCKFGLLHSNKPQAVLLLPFSTFRQEEYFDY